MLGARTNISGTTKYRVAPEPIRGRIARKQFDVTHERIRQIESKALRKLKHPSRSDKLRSFMGTL
jgi:hypothetical protein